MSPASTIAGEPLHQGRGPLVGRILLGAPRGRVRMVAAAAAIDVVVAAAAAACIGGS